MALAQVGQYYQLQFQGTFNGQFTLNQFMYQLTEVDAGVTVTQASNALNSLVRNAGSLMTHYLACMPSNYRLEQIWIQVIYPVRLVKNTYNVGVFGNWQTEGHTSNVSAVITRKGELANRKNISSLHLPAPTDDVTMDQGFWSNGYMTALGTLAADCSVGFVDVPTGATWLATIYHRTEPQTVTPILSAVPQTTVRTERRRTVGRGI